MVIQKKKIYLAVKNVRDFIDELSNELRIEYLNIVNKLEDEGRLVEPYGKKLSNDLFEMRIRKGKQVRVIYFYHGGSYVYGVHAFTKKTQKTPLKDIKYAKKIVSQIKRGEYYE